MDSRYLESLIGRDALTKRKIAFLSGPRQVGKTTLAQSLLAAEGSRGQYYTWDDDEFKVLWTRGLKPVLEKQKPSLVVLDEIHKDRTWKNRLKGIYDLLRNDVRFVVTGSARLDFYRKSGDSLQGRYFPYRLHPFSLNEKSEIPVPPRGDWEGTLQTRFKLEDLLELGGFPEPLFGGKANEAQRWRRLHRERMVREDLRDLKDVRNVEAINTLALLLTQRVSATLSYDNLRSDLKVAFDTAKDWVGLLEALFYCFRIRPYSRNIKKSLTKEPKLYLTDWSTLTDNTGARLENFLACQLLKACQAWSDAAMGEFDLHYVRDRMKREVDFLITRDRKPYALIEAKSSQSTPTDALVHFQSVLKPEFTFQVVQSERSERGKQLAYPGIQVIALNRLLSRLP